MLLEALDIRKTYPSPGRFFPFTGNRVRTTALAGVSLTLSAGTVTGLAGPNGAGKSTLLRVLAGRLTPDSGQICVNGLRTDGTALRTAAALAETGARSFYPRLSARENLDFFGALHGLSREETRVRTEPLREALFMRDDDLNARYDSLSEGAAQKVSLLRALVRRAPLLLLDEPARNLDLRSAAAFSGLIRELAAVSGTAVLYISHDPAELAGVCGRLLALKDGKLTSGTGASGGIGADAAKACAGDL